VEAKGFPADFNVQTCVTRDQVDERSRSPASHRHSAEISTEVSAMKKVRLHISLLALALPVLMTACGYAPNTGLYRQNYVSKVGNDSPWLIHPTGEFKEYGDYEPSYLVTQDMDQVIVDMTSKGFMMIGYSAFNTRESEAYGRQRAEDTAPGWLTRRIAKRMADDNSDVAPVGDPRIAARSLNAEVVYEQRGYSFSRKGYEERTYLANQYDDATSRAGGGRSGHQDTYTSNQQGSSSVTGQASTKGSFEQEGVGVGASVGKDTLGSSGSLSGQYNKNWGSNKSQTNYNEQGTSQMNRLDQSTGKAFQDYNDKMRHQSQHWATTFLDKDIDHYDYLVTFWKRVDRKKMALGAVTEPVPKTLWKSLGTRQGRFVSQVIGGTPASDADIWEGDVLLAINGEKITSEEGWGKLLQRYQGQEVKITLWRDGNFFEAPVMLN
jgi:hypothetical protein